jgi:hypothetical protein
MIHDAATIANETGTGQFRQGNKETTPMARILVFATACFAIAQFQIDGQIAVAEDRSEITELPMQQRAFARAPDSDELWVRSIEDWQAVRSHWFVGILYEAPAATGMPLAPDESDESRRVAVVAVNIQDGKAKWLRPHYGGQYLDSVVPLRDHRCGFTLKRMRNGSEPRQEECQIREWNLHTDQIGDPRDWYPLMSLVARIVDASRLKLAWQSGSPNEPGSAQVELTLAGGAKILVPAPLEEYSLPVEMSMLWEEGQETR